MPKWLVNATLKKLGKIDKMHEAKQITTEEHDIESRKAIEFALAVEKNIYKKKIRKLQDKRVLGKME